MILKESTKDLKKHKKFKRQSTTTIRQRKTTVKKEELHQIEKDLLNLIEILKDESRKLKELETKRESKWSKTRKNRINKNISDVQKIFKD